MRFTTLKVGSAMNADQFALVERLYPFDANSLLPLKAVISPFLEHWYRISIDDEKRCRAAYNHNGRGMLWGIILIREDPLKPWTIAGTVGPAEKPFSTWQIEQGYVRPIRNRLLQIGLKRSSIARLAALLAAMVSSLLLNLILLLMLLSGEDVTSTHMLAGVAAVGLVCAWSYVWARRSAFSFEWLPETHQLETRAGTPAHVP